MVKFLNFRNAPVLQIKFPGQILTAMDYLISPPSVQLTPASKTPDPFDRGGETLEKVCVDGEDQWVIDKLVKRRIRGRERNPQVEYLVRWKGCGPEDDEWVKRRELI
ncbi:hypothetical protein THAR02_07147 [Trichoderma harzianum]|uniref:Chromo domain-containing protein n=1 Tax=Trichoderma harzianum TaxID=5544 RepID=A0A0F9X886_TRIHA|nr:hypothetical protein THAR02_07147 [Trichoderma harzianum]